jgi:hypothetical protein
MSATADPITRTEEHLRTELVDQEWFCAALKRWQTAAEYVFFLDAELLPTGHALRRMVGEDVPKLLRELLRLRPDLR